MKKKRILIPGLLILVALPLPGCAKTAPQAHVHTWENYKCASCGEEKEIQKLGNWEYVLWEEEEAMEIVSFPETDEKVFFRDLPEGISKVRIGDGCQDKQPRNQNTLLFHVASSLFRVSLEFSPFRHPSNRHKTCPIPV